MPRHMQRNPLMKPTHTTRMGMVLYPTAGRGWREFVLYDADIAAREVGGSHLDESLLGYLAVDGAGRVHAALAVRGYGPLLYDLAAFHGRRRGYWASLKPDKQQTAYAKTFWARVGKDELRPLTRHQFLARYGADPDRLFDEHEPQVLRLVQIGRDRFSHAYMDIKESGRWESGLPYQDRERRLRMEEAKAAGSQPPALTASDLQEVSAGLAEMRRFLPASRSNPPMKTYADLMQALDDLGLGVLGLHFLHDTMKSCGATSGEVAGYLQERGFVVDTRGGAVRYGGHFNLGVLTTDRGWISVDPTFMQFCAPYDGMVAMHRAAKRLGIDPEEVDAREDFYDLVAPEMAGLMAHYDAIVHQGRAAFEVEPMPAPVGTPRPGPAPQKDSRLRDLTWGDTFSRYRRSVESLLAGKPRRQPGFLETMWMRHRSAKKNPISAARRRPAAMPPAKVWALLSSPDWHVSQQGLELLAMASPAEQRAVNRYAQSQGWLRRGEGLPEADASLVRASPAEVAFWRRLFASGVLAGTDLHGTYWGGYDLRGAKLQGANLEDCELEQVRLDGADLTGANLEGARLVDCFGIPPSARTATITESPMRKFLGIEMKAPDDTRANPGPRGGYSPAERAAVPTRMFLKPSTRSWPVGDRAHAQIALQYMTRGFGQRKEYAQYIRRLAQLWPPADPANAAIWAMYDRHHDTISRIAGAAMPRFSSRPPRRARRNSWRDSYYEAEALQRGRADGYAYGRRNPDDDVDDDPYDLRDWEDHDGWEPWDLPNEPRFVTQRKHTERARRMEDLAREKGFDLDAMTAGGPRVRFPLQPQTAALSSKLRSYGDMLRTWDLNDDRFPDYHAWIQQNWTAPYGQKEAEEYLSAIAAERSNNYWNVSSSTSIRGQDRVRKATAALDAILGDLSGDEQGGRWGAAQSNPRRMLKPALIARANCGDMGAIHELQRRSRRR